MKVIYCAGEQGRVVLDILRISGIHDDVVFIDDDQSLHGKSVVDVPVIGGREEIPTLTDGKIQCIIAFGDRPDVRLSIVDALSDVDCEFFNAIHPSSTISQTVTLGQGITINGQSYIGPGSILNSHTLVDSCVNISHDCIIKTGATITPSATLAGGVEIGCNAYIGPNATILEELTIGDNAVVGAGSVVTKDVPPETEVIGIPATSSKG